MLYLNKNLILESNCELESAKFVLLGIPFDATATNMPGSRFAPLGIRREFLELEKEVGGKSFFDIPFLDLGNIEIVPGDVKKTNERVEKTLAEVLDRNGDVTILALGGEHTISYPVIKLLAGGNAHVLQLDAHMDLRGEYCEAEWCHATVMHKVSKLGVPITQIGVRSMSDEEVKFAKSGNISCVGVDEDEIKDAINELRGKRVYISVDMDVLDPSVAPGVSNPTPGGISFNTLKDVMINTIEIADVVGLDIVEVCPLYDATTSVMAAKILLDFVISKDGKT